MAPKSRTYGTITTRMEVAGQTRVFRIWDTPLSRSVSQEVLTGKSYPRLPVLGEVRTILDVGAHVGMATMYFALHWPRARVLAFEPAPDSYELLVANTRDVANVTTFNVGLLDREEQVPLYLGQEDPATDSIAASVLNTAEYVMVDLRDAKSFLQGQGIEAVDILKLDTEGCEVPILHSLHQAIPAIGVVYAEYHAEDDRREIDRTLAGTHVLWHCRVPGPHRGEVCYVLGSRIPAEFAQMRVVLHGSPTHGVP